MPLTEHLANERTFLAWLRTALALLAFGFVIERFAIYLQYALDASIPPQETAHATGLGKLTMWIGTGLIPLALWRYLDEAKNIDRGLTRPYQVWPIVLLAIVFGVIASILSIKIL